MSILSDSAILAARKKGDIVIEPWDESCLGPNSYDVHLGKNLIQVSGKNPYRFLPNSRFPAEPDNTILHCAEPCEETPVLVHKDLVMLLPGRLYLAVTQEYTETRGYVPYIDGKSSIGRLGVFTHVTAGRGDASFCGYWTLELVVTLPTRLKIGMPICQITYHTIEGEVLRPYDTRGSYVNARQDDPWPQTSKLWKKLAAPSDFVDKRTGTQKP